MAVQQRNFESLSHFALLPTTTITGTGAQTAVDLLGYDGDIVLTLTGSAAGSGADLTFTVEHSTVVDGSGDAFASIPAAAGTAAFTAIGNAVYREVKVLNVGACKRFLRINCTAETGTASSAATCTGFGVLKYQS
jgi:hypothetical protein